MRRNLETDGLGLADDDQFHRRLDEFTRLSRERIRMLPWTILSFPRNFWYFLIYLGSFITDIFLRHYIAVIVLVLSVFMLPAGIVVFRGDERLNTVMYCLSFITCSVLSIFYKRGRMKFTYECRSEQLERQKLLAEHSRPSRQGSDQPAGYGAKNKRQHLQRAVENLMEPRREGEVHRSISKTLLNCRDESSAGPSHALDCFTITSISDDSYDSDEPPQRLFHARISIDALKCFGPPLQVFGADSYKVVLHSSDENCSSDDDAEVKHFEVPVELHHTGH